MAIFSEKSLFRIELGVQSKQDGLDSQGRVKCRVCCKIDWCWQRCLAGDITGGLTGEDSGGMKMGLGVHRRRREERWGVPKLTPPEKKALFSPTSAPDGLERSGLKGAKSRNSSNWGSGCTGCAWAGDGGQSGIWLCPSALGGGDEMLSGPSIASWKLFTVGKEGAKLPFCSKKKSFFDKVILERGRRIINPHNATSLENSTEHAIFCQKVDSFLLLAAFQPQHLSAHKPQHQMRNVPACGRGLHCRYQVRWPCWAKTLLGTGPQSHRGQLQTCSDLRCLLTVAVPTGKGCLGPCLKCIWSVDEDGTCHRGVPLWASPSQDDSSRPWDDCTARFIPGSAGI